MGRIATVIVVILGIAWIPVMKELGKVLYAYLQDVQSLLAPGIAAVFLLGVVSRRTTPAAGYAGLVVGFILGMLRLALKVIYGDRVGDDLLYQVVEPNWLHYEIALFIIIIALMVIVSMFTRPVDPARIEGLYFGSASEKQKAISRASWNKWDVIHSVVILVFIIGFYVYFW